MKYLAFLIIALTNSHHAFTQTLPQNLCRDARTGSDLYAFADDPSACDRFLLCHFDASGNVIKVEQGQCFQEGFKVFFNGACFPETEVTCSDDPEDDPAPDHLICPGLENINILFAVTPAAPTVDNCQQHAICHPDHSSNIRTCLRESVFDRSSGTCASPLFAPCEIYNRRPAVCPDPADIPPGGVNVEYPGTCDGFIICLPDGEESGPFFCVGGWHFNPDEGKCDEPQFRRPPCPLRQNSIVRRNGSGIEYVPVPRNLRSLHEL